MRDDFSPRTIEILARRVGFRCSNPSCRNSTVGPGHESERTINIGVAAHITAALPGGPRYEAAIDADQRSDAGNGIWLCQNCAKLIDSDVIRYSHEVLLKWKNDAEVEALEALKGDATGSDRTPGILSLMPRSLPRSEPYEGLRTLSQRHLESAGLLPSARVFAQKAELARLYVDRDVESEVINKVYQEHDWFFGLIEGEPGHGKTSVMWSLTHKFSAKYDSFFLQAAILKSDSSGLERLGLRGGSADLPQAIVSSAATRNRRPVLLLDSVDLLLHTDADTALVL